jgi:hypothetical protein
MEPITFSFCLTKEIDDHLPVKRGHAFCFPAIDDRLVQCDPLPESHLIESGAFQKPLKVLLLCETYISLHCGDLLVFSEVQIKDRLISWLKVHVYRVLSDNLVNIVVNKPCI